MPAGNHGRSFEQPRAGPDRRPARGTPVADGRGEVSPFVASTSVTKKGFPPETRYRSARLAPAGAASASTASGDSRTSARRRTRARPAARRSTERNGWSAAAHRLCRSKSPGRARSPRGPRHRHHIESCLVRPVQILEHEDRRCSSRELVDQGGKALCGAFTSRDRLGESGAGGAAISTNGAKGRGVRSPSHAPRDTLRCGRGRLQKSRTRAVFPIPASPVTRTSRPGRRRRPPTRLERLENLRVPAGPRGWRG